MNRVAAFAERNEEGRALDRLDEPQRGREHLVAACAGVEAEMRLCVRGGASAEELLQARRGISPKKGARAIGDHARHEHANRGDEPEDVRGAQGMPTQGGVDERAAAARDHLRIAGVEQASEQRRLALAKARLALTGEELGDRVTGFLSQQLVEVDEAATEAHRERPPDGALADTGWAGENELTLRRDARRDVELRVRRTHRPSITLSG